MLGPLKAILEVRTSTQVARGNLEIELLGALPELEQKLVHVVLRPPFLPDRGDPPLSWHLSRRDKRRVCLDWIAQREAVAPLTAFFPDAPGTWPTPEECEARRTW